MSFFCSSSQRAITFMRKQTRFKHPTKYLVGIPQSCHSHQKWENLRNYLSSKKCTLIFMLVAVYLDTIPKAYLNVDFSMTVNRWLSSLGGINIWLLMPKVLFHKMSELMIYLRCWRLQIGRPRDLFFLSPIKKEAMIVVFSSS